MARRLLNIQVIEANLLRSDRNDLNPIFTVQLVDIANRKIKNEEYKCRNVSIRSKQPAWKEVFSLGHYYNLQHQNSLPSLLITLIDRARFGLDTEFGTVQVSLEKLIQTPEVDAWFDIIDLKQKPSGNQIHLKLSLTGGILNDENVEDPTVISEDEEKYQESPPNELHIHLVGANGLKVADFPTGSSDPLVIFRIGDEEKRSSIIEKNLNPIWNERFIIPVNDTQASLEVIVEDNDLTTNDFLGKVTIPLLPLQDKHTDRKSYILQNSRGQTSQKLGKIELILKWKFSATVAATPKKSSIFTSFFKDSDSEVEDDDKDEDPDNETPKSEEEIQKEKQAKEEADAALKAELKEIEIKNGDYQLQVHIIEARDLKGEDVSGLSDPVVYVEAFNQKQCTLVNEQCLSCVWDELLIFNFRNLDKDQVQEAIIKINVMDADTLKKNDLIGSYVIDATTVYFQKDHEMYRQWVALIDDENPDDNGVQGYLKFSIALIGPGDKLKVHDQEEDRKKEALLEAGGNGIANLVVMPPVIKKETVFLVSTIVRAESLPMMDLAKLGGVVKGGIDAFCQVDFGANPPCRTKVKTIKGDRLALNPQFYTELWVPVTVPTMTKKIKYSLWDYDRIGSNELVATFYGNFGQIDKMPEKKMAPFWINLYGAALGLSTVPVVGGVNYKEQHNTYPDKATTFRGRVLISQRIENVLPKGYEKIETFRRRVKPLRTKDEPSARPYRLRALVCSGSELPQIKSITNAGRNAKLQLRVSCGALELFTERVENNNGVSEWFQLLESEILTLPMDIDQVPDIFISLCKGAGSDLMPICFTRFSAANLLNKKLFNEPEWIFLKKDHAVGALSDADFPGTVLVRLYFGTLENYDETRTEWERMQVQSRERVPYELRVHLYQARNLPAADDNGLMDPIFKINVLGKREESKPIKMTTDPMIYQTFRFDCQLPVLDKFMPQVNIQLWDWDLTVNDYCGCCFFPVKNAFRLQSLDQPLPDPDWLSFMIEEPGDGKGEVLVSFQLIRKDRPDTILPPPPSIIPETREAFIEIIALGCRNMLPFQFIQMELPFLEFEVDTAKGKNTVSTITSKHPDPTNPNFLQRIIMPVVLPQNALFSPPLKYRARDTRLGGYMKPVVGVGSLNLMTKIPWSKAYLPPQASTFIDPKEMAGAPIIPSDRVAAVEPAKKTYQVKKGKVAGRESFSFDEEKKGDYAEKTDDEFKSNYVNGVLVQPPRQNLQSMVQELVDQEDCGAGVFNALHHFKDEIAELEKKALKAKKKAGLVETNDDEDSEEEEDDDFGPPAYMKGRAVLPSEIEDLLKTSPFETYELLRGQNRSDLGGSNNQKVVGIFKGLIRVISDEHEPPVFDINQLLKPQAFKVRVYVLRGFGLTPMDPGFAGRPGKSDPYLLVKLGKTTMDDRLNYIQDQVEVDFCKCFEFNAELPGASRLEINCMDYDDIGTDDLIGRTVIDLEDRWFDSRWQKLGKENRCEIVGQMRCETKPLERRSLYTPTSNAPQGTLELWVDILFPYDASAFPLDDVSLPPTLGFEVRLVIWKTKDVVSMDDLTGMNDLFVKCWIEGCDPQETDTHWRSKKGKGSFNWRMKFDVELGHNTRAMKFPYLHLQMWDRDILKWNDCIAETSLNLGKYFQKAYRKNHVIKLFDDTKKKLNKRKQNDVEINGPRNKTETLNGKGLELNETKYESKPNSSNDEEKLLNGAEDSNDLETKPLIQNEDDKEIKDFVNSVKEMTGLWDIDPPSSDWLFMDRLNFESQKREPMGQLCLSLEIWPKLNANMQPVGFGRNEPNQNPYLAPPTGRLQWSWNPIKLGLEIFGPALCAKLACCLICLAFLALMIFCQPALNIIIALVSY